MTNGLIRTSFLVAGIFVTLCAATSAHALSDRQKCVLAIPKAAQKYVAAKVKLEQKCKNAGFKDGSCTMPDSAAVAKIEAKLDAALTKACSLIPFLLRSSGFPGPCSDPNPGDDFTTADL
jgi:hypothetical protein